MRIGVLLRKSEGNVVSLFKTRAEVFKYLERKGGRWEIEFLHPYDKRVEQIKEDIGKCDIYLEAKQAEVA